MLQYGCVLEPDSSEQKLVEGNGKRFKQVVVRIKLKKIKSNIKCIHGDTFLMYCFFLWILNYTKCEVKYPSPFIITILLLFLKVINQSMALVALIQGNLSAN